MTQSGMIPVATKVWLEYQKRYGLRRFADLNRRKKLLARYWQEVEQRKRELHGR